jgi:hypothetical protein
MGKYYLTTSLPGADAPTPSDASLPPKLRSETKKYTVTVPFDKGGGDSMLVSLDGELTYITIPVYKQDGVTRFKAGDSFIFVVEPDTDKVIASTLPSIPGMQIVNSKAMILSIAKSDNYGHPDNVAALLKKAQIQLLEKTIQVGCNAALGINTSITYDSSGRHGDTKTMIICLTATPSIAVTLQQAQRNSPVQATAPALDTYC